MYNNNLQQLKQKIINLKYKIESYEDKIDDLSEELEGVERQLFALENVNIDFTDYGTIDWQLLKFKSEINTWHPDDDSKQFLAKNLEDCPLHLQSIFYNICQN